MPEQIFSNSGLFGQISSLVVDENDNLYASNFNSPPATIVKVSKNGAATLLATITPGSISINFAGMVYVNGYLYVTGYNYNVYKVDINSGTITVFVTLPQDGTLGITYVGGYFYIVSGARSPNRVYKVTLDGLSYSVFYEISNSYNLLYITADTSGNFYITSYRSSNVIQLNSSGQLITSNFITSNSNVPNTIIFHDNQFYCSNGNVNKVSQYDINGALITDNYAFGGQTYYGGGIVFDSKNNFYVSNDITYDNTHENGIYTIQSPPIPCFKEGSKILTDKGYICVEDLHKGDLVQTLNHGFVPIHMIGYRKIHNHSDNHNEQMLYKCSSEHYPELLEDLIITGHHSILVDKFKEGERAKTEKVLGRIYLTDAKARLPVCVDTRATPYKKEGTFTVYHFSLENDNDYMNYGVYANGLLVESSSKRYLRDLSGMYLKNA
uniref:Hedgehog/Intein (Hint) domain-containing protein n=1 Tax=viral metagenome TaxID=1070528 RepID=A0A6C0E464_9ZZZZ